MAFDTSPSQWQSGALLMAHGEGIPPQSVSGRKERCLFDNRIDGEYGRNENGE
jgi:hypothetical protein